MIYNTALYSTLLYCIVDSYNQYHYNISHNRNIVLHLRKIICNFYMILCGRFKKKEFKEVKESVNLALIISEISYMQ